MMAFDQSEDSKDSIVSFDQSEAKMLRSDQSEDSIVSSDQSEARELSNLSQR